MANLTYSTLPITLVKYRYFDKIQNVSNPRTWPQTKRSKVNILKNSNQIWIVCTGFQILTDAASCVKNVHVEIHPSLSS